MFAWSTPIRIDYEIPGQPTRHTAERLGADNDLGGARGALRDLQSVTTIFDDLSKLLNWLVEPICTVFDMSARSMNCSAPNYDTLDTSIYLKSAWHSDIDRTYERLLHQYLLSPCWHIEL